MKNRKSLLIGVIVSVVLALALAAGSVRAVSTVTETILSPDPSISVITWRWTADAYTATVSPETSNINVNGYVFLVITDPGSTAPTANYDITLSDENSCDIMGGELYNRSATATEQAVPKIGSVYGSRYVSGPIQMTIFNNSVSSANGMVSVYYYRDK